MSNKTWSWDWGGERGEVKFRKQNGNGGDGEVGTRGNSDVSSEKNEK